LQRRSRELLDNDELQVCSWSHQVNITENFFLIGITFEVF
jgi:hypothetical protein